MSKVKRNVYVLPRKRKLSVYVRPQVMMELKLRAKSIGVTVSKLVSDIIEYYITDEFGGDRNANTTDT